MLRSGRFQKTKIYSGGEWGMTNFRPAGFAVALLLATTGVSSAQTAPAGPSVYLQCDGNPPHRSTGELLGRALLMSATLGLAGQGEVQDVSKRAYGTSGVDACDAALLQESDSTRKVLLTLARAIHNIEAGNNAAAQEDAAKAPSLASNAQDIGFRHTLLVSSLELQAAALVRQSDFPKASAAALEMANSAPYDVVAQVRAVPYVQLTAEISPEKQAYLDRLVKIFPEALGFRAIAYQWAGRYLDAAADYAAIADLRAGFSAGNDPPPLPDVQAMRSAMLALGGKMDESAAVAAETSAMIHVLAATGKTGLMQTSIDTAEQALDFQAIVVDLAAGRASAARIKFAARSHWSVPAVPAVAELAARLRQGAPAAELTGPLATDPDSMRNDGLVANAGAITEANNAVASLYGVIRRPIDAATYQAWSDDVWNTKSSVFLHKRAANETYAGELMMVSRTPGFFAPPHLITIAAGDALLMHCALMAQARGVKGFELFPSRKLLEAFFVRFGDPGEPGMPGAATFDAATVIADLSSEFPDPSKKGAAAGSSAPANP
jgi:hypothetical protein